MILDRWRNPVIVGWLSCVSPRRRLLLFSIMMVACPLLLLLPMIFRIHKAGPCYAFPPAKTIHFVLECPDCILVSVHGPLRICAFGFLDHRLEVGPLLFLGAFCSEGLGHESERIVHTRRVRVLRGKRDRRPQFWPLLVCGQDILGIRGSALSANPRWR